MSCVYRVERITWHSVPAYAVPDGGEFVVVVRSPITGDLRCVVCCKPPHSPCDHMLEAMYFEQHSKEED